MNEAPKIGLDQVHIARVLSDDVNGIVYDTPIALKGAVNASVNPNSDVATDYGDNGVFFVTNNRGNTEMSLELIGIDPATRALMLGQTRVNGVTVETPLDQSPYFAVGFRVWIAGEVDGEKRYQYFWYAKGKFSVPETGGSTKKESIEFGHENMTAQFAQTEYNGVICTHARNDDPDVSASIIANWFNAPIVETSVSTSAVKVEAEITGSGKLVLTGSKGTGEAFKFAESSAIVGDTIIVTDDNGKSMAGTLAFGGTTTAPTITFTKATTEAGTITAVSVTSGLKDNYGVGVTPMIDASLS